MTSPFNFLTALYIVSELMHVSVYMKTILKSPQELHSFRFSYNSKSQINQNRMIILQ